MLQLIPSHRLIGFHGAITHIRPHRSMKMDINKPRKRIASRGINLLFIRCTVLRHEKALTDTDGFFMELSVYPIDQCITYSHASPYKRLKAASSATMVTSLCNCNTDACTFGVIAPHTASCSALALSSPLTTTRIFLACIMDLIPMV